MNKPMLATGRGTTVALMLAMGVATVALAQPRRPQPPSNLQILTEEGLTVTLAQFTPPEPPRRPLAAPEPERGLRGPIAPGPAAQWLNPQRVLNDEQRESFRAATAAQREKVRELEEKLRQARRDLMEAALEDRADEAVIRRKASAIGELEGKLLALRMEALRKIEPPLSAEQIEQLKNPPPPEWRERRGLPDQPPGPALRDPERRRREGLPPRDRPPDAPRPRE